MPWAPLASAAVTRPTHKRRHTPRQGRAACPEGEGRHARKTLKTAADLAGPCRIEPHNDGRQSGHIFGSGSGVDDAVPARIARKAVAELRHDVEIPQQQRDGALVEATRSVRSLAKRPVISASIAGFLMDDRVVEPGKSAACAPRNSRCSIAWATATAPRGR